jgi:hypothetical protein
MLLFFLACGNLDPKNDSSVHQCTVDEDRFDVEASRNEKTGIAEVSWTGAPQDVIYYSYESIDGITEKEIHIESVQSTERYSSLLWGGAISSAATVSIERYENSNCYRTTSLSIPASSLPATFPSFEGKKFAETPTGYVLTTITTEETRFLAMFNLDEGVVWFYEVPYNQEHVPLSHIEITERGIIFTENAPDSSSKGFINTVSWTGVELEKKQISGLNIGFVVLGDDHFLALTSEMLPEGVDEDVLIEIQGETQREIWRATDDFDLPAENALRNSWVHSNYLHFDSDNNKLYLSMDLINAVGQMDLSRVEFDWIIGGLGSSDSDFYYYPEIVARPHSIKPYADGFVILNRGNLNTAEHACADVTYFQIDENISMERQIPFEPCSSLGFFGEALPLQDDFILTTWSDRGQINIYDTNGEACFQLNLHLGAVFGFSVWNSSLP